MANAPASPAGVREARGLKAAAPIPIEAGEAGAVLDLSRLSADCASRASRRHLAAYIHAMRGSVLSLQRARSIRRGPDETGARKYTSHESRKRPLLLAFVLPLGRGDADAAVHLSFELYFTDRNSIKRSVPARVLGLELVRDRDELLQEIVVGRYSGHVIKQVASRLGLLALPIGASESCPCLIVQLWIHSISGLLRAELVL